MDQDQESVVNGLSKSRSKMKLMKWKKMVNMEEKMVYHMISFQNILDKSNSLMICKYLCNNKITCFINLSVKILGRTETNCYIIKVFGWLETILLKKSQNNSQVPQNEILHIFIDKININFSIKFKFKIM